MIDKDINASFSFDPKGKNTFLLFTESGEIYSSPTPANLTIKELVFEMKNITDQIKTSDGLKRYLEQ